MIKYFLILLSGFLFCQNAVAQKADTLVFYLKNSGEVVTTKDSADYIRMVMPSNNSGKTKLYPVNDFYPNGKLKMTAVSKKQILDVQLHMHGTTTFYYPNGTTKEIDEYGDMDQFHKDEMKTVTDYYPNGQLYTIRKLNSKYRLLLVECHDTTGKVLATDGNGYWPKMDKDYKKITDEGPVKDGMQDGSWHGRLGDTIKYECVYNQGKITKGTGYDKMGQSYSFTEIFSNPMFNGKTMYQYLAYNFKYPAYDKEKDIEGKMIFSFDVATDGKAVHLKFLRSPEQHFTDEMLGLMNASGKWTIGFICGIPTSGPFITPFNFTLQDGDDE